MYNISRILEELLDIADGLENIDSPLSTRKSAKEELEEIMREAAKEYIESQSGVELPNFFELTDEQMIQTVIEIDSWLHSGYPLPKPLKNEKDFWDWYVSLFVE
jgi:predicted house-cleaning noncanonical NTP pyrophosphatase (MazG superfamily)